MIISKDNISQYVTNDNIKAQDVRIKVTRHPEPKKGWHITNALANAVEDTLQAGQLTFLITSNMETTTDSKGKVTELGKFDAPLYCPVTWSTRYGNRNIKSIEHVHAFVMDMDKLSDEQTESVFQRLMDSGLCYNAYSSYSNTAGNNAFRVIIPISKPVTPDQYTKMWRYMCTYFPENDGQTKDPSRLWFFPCTRIDREIHSWQRSGDGGMIDINSIMSIVSNTPQLPKPTTNAPTHSDGAVVTTNNDSDRYKIITCPPSYPITGHDGQTRTFDWYIEQWFNLPKRDGKYQCYAPGSGTMGSAFIHRSTNPFGISRYRITCVNKMKTHMDCIGTDNGLELRYLDRNSEWEYLPVLDNMSIVLESMQLDLWYCEIRQRCFTKAEPITDAVELQILSDMRKKYFCGRKIDLKDVRHAILLACTRNTRNTLVEYLEELVWDGEERLDTLLIDYLKAEDNALNRVYGRKWAISAVARVLQAGCKVDTMLTLKAGQGHGKGTFFRILSGECPVTKYSWYNSSQINIGEKDGRSILRTAWIHEMAELANLARKDANIVKNFLDEPHDTFRRAYTAHEVKVPRTSIFVGSTNDDDVGIFKDKTGSRRYWFVECKSTENHMGYSPKVLSVHRDQIWAEAVHRFKAGEQWWLTADEQQLSSAENRNKSVIGIHETMVANYVEDNAGKFFTIQELLDTVYASSTIKPSNYENYYPSLLLRLGCELQNNGNRCRRNGVNKSGWYLAPNE